MHFNPKISFIALALLVLGFSACLRTENFPDTPVIEYKNFEKVQDINGKDSIGILTFSFTDGNGDIGLAQGDTIAPFNEGSQYYHNLWIEYFEQQDGQFVKVELPFSINARIPVITPEGQNKALQGEIDVDLFINNPTSQYDTIKFSAQLVDRALNESNVIETPAIHVVK